MKTSSQRRERNNQKLTSILERKKSPRPPEQNFIQMIKNKILENKRFRFDKEYLDISTFNDYSQISTSIDNPSLGRHKDNTKKFVLECEDTPSGNNAVQGNQNLKFSIDPPIVYEEIIQKYEADVRMHLRHQNFLKLHIDSLQHNLEVSARDIKALKSSLEETKEIKEKSEKLHHKEMAESKSNQDKLEKQVQNLKEKIKELDTKLSTRNAHPTQTMDKRDPLFITLNSQPGGQLSQNKYVFPSNNRSNKELNFSPDMKQKKKLTKLKPSMIVSDKHINSKKSPFHKSKRSNSKGKKKERPEGFKMDDFL